MSDDEDSVAVFVFICLFDLVFKISDEFFPLFKGLEFFVAAQQRIVGLDRRQFEDDEVGDAAGFIEGFGKIFCTQKFKDCPVASACL